MNSLQRKILVCLLTAALCINSAILSQTVFANCKASYDENEEPEGIVMLVDVVLVRPLTFVTSIAGAAIWIVSLPFTLLGGNTEQAGDVLVMQPICYTFVRPVGHMEKNN